MVMRQIVFDTETTGFSPVEGDRIVEIGCIEVIDRIKTGNNFHVYLNPERDMPESAFKVHGLSSEFLSDKPLFKDIAAQFLTYIDGAELIAHNAKFDMQFLDAEYQKLGDSPLSTRFVVIDTLAIAKDLRPGQRNSLDALCRAYDIDNTQRTLHGALLDAELLTEVYLAMTGGQFDLLLTQDNSTTIHDVDEKLIQSFNNNDVIVVMASKEEVDADRLFFEKMVHN